MATPVSPFRAPAESRNYPPVTPFPGKKVQLDYLSCDSPLFLVRKQEVPNGRWLLQSWDWVEAAWFCIYADDSEERARIALRNAVSSSDDAEETWVCDGCHDPIMRPSAGFHLAGEHYCGAHCFLKPRPVLGARTAIWYAAIIIGLLSLLLVAAGRL